jgi:co-chaperonin GroES (HSP10)
MTTYFVFGHNDDSPSSRAKWQKKEVPSDVFTKEKPQRGVIVAAGKGKTDEPMTVKVGDTVLYGKYAGTEVQIEGQDLLIMRESDLLAIL